MTRYTVHFTGRVQGVGFRYTTCNVARSYKVAGYVQNLSDGGVRLVAEGEESELKAFVAGVCEAMSGYVSNHAISKSDATGEFGKPAPGALGVRY